MKVKVLNAQTQIEVREINLHEFTMATGECLLGRSPHSGLVLDSPDVSRLHAKFALKDGQYYFYDLGSANGSLINGQIAKANQGYLLHPGDIVRLGEFVLMLQDVSESPEDLPATVVGDPDATVMRTSQPSAMNLPAATPPVMIGESVSSSIEGTDRQPNESITAAEAASPTVEEQRTEPAEPLEFIESISELAEDEVASLDEPQIDTSHENEALTSAEGTVIQFDEEISLDEEISEVIAPIEQPPLHSDEPSVTLPVSPSESATIQPIETVEAIAPPMAIDETIESISPPSLSEQIDSESSDRQLEDTVDRESEPFLDTLVPDEATVGQPSELEEAIDGSFDLTSSVAAEEPLSPLSELVTSAEATVIQSVDELLPETALSEPTVIQSSCDFNEIPSDDQAASIAATESVPSSEATVIQSAEEMQDIEALIDSLSTPDIASEATVIQPVEESIEQLPPSVSSIEISEPNPQPLAPEPVHLELDMGDVWDSPIDEPDELVLSQLVVEESDREPGFEPDISDESTSVQSIEDAVASEQNIELADEPIGTPSIDAAMTEPMLPDLPSIETMPPVEEVLDQDPLLQMPNPSGIEPADIGSAPPVAEVNDQLADDAGSLESVDESDRPLTPSTVDELDIDLERTLVLGELASDTEPESEKAEEIETMELETIASDNLSLTADQAINQVIDEPLEPNITNRISDIPDISINEPETVEGDIPVPVVEVTETIASVSIETHVPAPITEIPSIFKQKYIALMAHDSQRAELIQFVTRYKDFLSQCLTIATPSISDMLKQQVGMEVSQQTPVIPLGGYQAVNSLVVSNQVLAVIFLRDFFTPSSTQANDEALSRSCNVNNVLLANNLATAEAIAHYISTAVISSSK